MELVKKLFGVMMLAVAAWMLTRITPERLTLVLWAVPAFALAWLLWTQNATRSRPVGFGAAPRGGCRRPVRRQRSPQGLPSATPIRSPRCPFRPQPYP